MAVDYLTELRFYNKHIKKPNVKRSKNIDQLPELPFYEQLSIIKANHVFGGYEMSYKVEIIKKKDPIVQLEASKSSITDLFSDLLNETKGFKYQSTFKYQVLSFVKKYAKSMEKLNLLQFISIQ